MIIVNIFVGCGWHSLDPSKLKTETSNQQLLMLALGSRLKRGQLRSLVIDYCEPKELSIKLSQHALFNVMDGLQHVIDNWSNLLSLTIVYVPKTYYGLKNHSKYSKKGDSLSVLSLLTRLQSLNIIINDNNKMLTLPSQLPLSLVSLSITHNASGEGKLRLPAITTLTSLSIKGFEIQLWTQDDIDCNTDGSLQYRQSRSRKDKIFKKFDDIQILDNEVDISKWSLPLLRSLIVPDTYNNRILWKIIQNGSPHVTHLDCSVSLLSSYLHLPLELKSLNITPDHREYLKPEMINLISSCETITRFHVKSYRQDSDNLIRKMTQLTSLSLGESSTRIVRLATFLKEMIISLPKLQLVNHFSNCFNLYHVNESVYIFFDYIIVQWKTC